MRERRPERTRGYWIGLALVGTALWGAASLATATSVPLTGSFSAVPAQGGEGGGAGRSVSRLPVHAAGTSPGPAARAGLAIGLGPATTGIPVEPSPADEPTISLPDTAPLDPPVARPLPPPGATPITVVAAPAIAAGPLRDRAGVMTPEARDQIESTVERVASEVGIFVITEVLSDLQRFEKASQDAFKGIVQETNHYRVVVIFIAYSADRRHGIISTNLGAGIWHIVNREECQDLFGGEEKPLSPAQVVDGVDRLVALLENYYRSKPRDDDDPHFAGLDVFLGRLPLLVLAGLLLGVGAVLYRKSRICPGCSGPLRSRVSVSLAWGARGRVAKRTAKCFRCGWSRRGPAWPF